MRYKENTGHFPFMKSKDPDQPTLDVSSPEDNSVPTSGLFERRPSNRTDPEKAIATVQALPARTDSE